MREEDLLDLRWVADPQISPDGTRIVFTRVVVDSTADEYRTSLWEIDARGGDPRPLTSGQRDAQPRWSPDGKTIAFVRAAEGKPAQIHLLSMAGGEATPLTRLTRGASQPTWSPDGRRIAFISSQNPALDGDTARAKPKHEPGRVVTTPVFRVNGAGYIDHDRPDHIWMIDAAGGAPRQVTSGRFDEGAARWSRDGKRLLFLSDRRAEPWFEPDDGDLYSVSADLKRPATDRDFQTVIDIAGPLGAWHEAADGRLLAVGNFQPAAIRSYDQDDLLLTEGTGVARRVRNVTEQYDYDVSGGISADQHPPRGGGQRPLAFTNDGHAAYVVVARHGHAALARVDLASGAVEELTAPEYEVIAGTGTPDGRLWAVTLGDVTRPGDLYLLDAETRELRKLWGPNDALLERLELGSVEEFWYRSFDGTRVQGWIVKPPRFSASRQYPMVMEIHGGPHTAYGVAFFHEFQMLAGAGYVVLYTNPRGSTSYGQEFGNVIQYRYPGDDARDLLAAVDTVLARGYVDSRRLGITGGSGGGLLTNWIIAQTPRFAAAVTDRCVADWASFYYSADFTLFTPTWFRKPPFEDPTESIERSPVTYAAKIETPLMIIHSEEDWRTPIGQGEAMFRALKQQKKTAVMVRFPGENHELSRSGIPSRRIQRLRHIHRWFDKYLLGKPVRDYDD
jgi:dipeptidyl aminopeptidase/acylaminoacyl peptidase